MNIRALLFLTPWVLLMGCDNGGGSKPATTPSDKAENANSEQEPDTSSLQTVTGLATGSRSEPVKVYFDLDTNKVVDITQEQESENSEWDVAFERTKVFLNTHKDNTVKLYFTQNTSDYYDESGKAILDTFLAANEDPNGLLSEFEAVTSIPEGAEFHSDSTVFAIDGFYNYASGVVTANPEANFIVRTDSSDAYSKFNVTNIVQDVYNMAGITLSIAHQASGTTEFGTPTDLVIETTSCTGDIYIDLDTAQTVNEADAWELSLPCAEGNASFELNLSPNSQALSGAYANASGVGDYLANEVSWQDNIVQELAIKKYGNPNSGYGWGEYGLNNGHLLWPNYSIFILRTATTDYKFQVIGYYDESATSGVYSIRFDTL